MGERNKKGTLEYDNLFNGKIKRSSDKKYQERFNCFKIDEKVKELFDKPGFKINRIINPKQKGSNEEYIYKIENSFNNKIIYISCYLIKNSGQKTDRKRIHVYPNYFGLNNNKEIKKNEEYFFLGLYPIDSIGNVVYALLENDGYSLNPVKSYSSLWIDFDAIKNAFDNGIYFSINKLNFNKYVVFTTQRSDVVIETIKNDDYSSIINKIDDVHCVSNVGKSCELKETDKCVEKYVKSRDVVVTKEGKEKIKKNAALRDVALVKANYTCALCGKDKTFVTKNNKQYFEAHHLIPCNVSVQEQFERKLDHVINLFCLCPECHREIHFTKKDHVKPLLEKLFESREKILKKFYDVDLKKIIDIYCNIDRSDEDDM